MFFKTQIEKKNLCRYSKIESNKFIRDGTLTLLRIYTLILFICIFRDTDLNSDF